MTPTRWVFALAALIVLSATPSWAAPITFNLAGSTISMSYGNSLEYEVDGLKLKVTAWGYTYGSSDNAFQTAALGRWSTGLGVCDQSEGARCGDPTHQVDNVGPDNFVLFAFDQPVDPTSIRIDPYGTWDRDVSYWVGNVADPFSLNLTGLTYASLSAPQWSMRIDDFASYSGSAREVSIGGGLANVILLGAAIGEPSSSYRYQDRFKIKAATVEQVNVVPEPSSMLLTGAGLALYRLRRRRQVS